MFVRKIFQKVKYFISIVRRFFIVPKFPENNEKMLVHIGCGDINSPNFINVDARPMEHVHYVTRNIDDLSFFSSKSIDLLYMCHVMEHFDRKKVKKITRECFRVLKKGGVLRISVPDFDQLIHIYFDNEKKLETIIAPLFGGQDYEFNYHYNMFNMESLDKFLKECGFSFVRKWNPDDARYHEFDDWSGRKFCVNNKEYIISLNIEAIK